MRGDVAWSNIADIPQRQVYRMAKTAFLKVEDADGLLIAGGGAPVYEIVEALEMDIGKPVVAHNFAAARHALSMAHVRDNQSTAMAVCSLCFEAAASVWLQRWRP